jgi:hypothetical protein
MFRCADSRDTRSGAARLVDLNVITYSPNLFASIYVRACSGFRDELNFPIDTSLPMCETNPTPDTYPRHNDGMELWSSNESNYGDDEEP